jgi:hypothetical protein
MRATPENTVCTVAASAMMGPELGRPPPPAADEPATILSPRFRRSRARQLGRSSSQPPTMLTALTQPLALVRITSFKDAAAEGQHRRIYTDNNSAWRFNPYVESCF